MHPINLPGLTAFARGEIPGPIGFRRDGRPVFPIAGGAEDDPAGGDNPPGDDPPNYTAPATQADLDRIIGDRLARERARFADYDEIKRKAAEHDAALEAAKTDADKAIDAARSEGEKAATDRVNERLKKSEARVLASAAKFRDPSDAVAFLDLGKVAVNESGEVDEAAITEQLKTLAETKPYLVDDGKRPAPRSDRSQGGGGSATRPTSVAEVMELRRAERQAKA